MAMKIQLRHGICIKKKVSGIKMGIIVSRFIMHTSSFPVFQCMVKIVLFN